MSVSFQPAGRDQIAAMFRVDVPPGFLWPDEAWEDYAAPIIVRRGGRNKVLLASYGMVPKKRLPPGVRHYSTMNARSETAPTLRSFARAWEYSQFCLVPMRAFYEPNWESGSHVRYRISRPDEAPFAVAGLWRAWEEEDGSLTHSFTQLTVNADGHDMLRRFHRAGDEKRSLVIVPPQDYDSWLACRDPERARGFMRLQPASDYACEPAPRLSPSALPRAAPDAMFVPGMRDNSRRGPAPAAAP